jgi:hypothetical protein
MNIMLFLILSALWTLPFTAETPQEGGYAIQVEATQDRSIAEQKVRQLKEQGLEAYWVKGSVPGKGVYYRVRIGQFPNKEAAMNFGASLKRQGIAPDFLLVTYQAPDPAVEARPAQSPINPVSAERQPESEISAILDGCYKVPPNVARFVVIPTEPSGVKVPDYTLRFQGVVSDRVAVTQYAVLSEGIEKGALKVYRGKYTVVLADPQSLDVVTSLSSTGVNAFDVEKRSIDQVLIGFWPEPVAPSKITWTDRTVSPALSGKCNLLNLVIFPTPSTQQDKKPEAWPIPAYVLPEHKAILQDWLRRNPKFRVATEADCQCADDLPEIRRQYDNDHPYYVTGDFNRDGRRDFAVVMIDTSKNHANDFNAAVVVFNGPLYTGMRPAFLDEGTGTPVGALLFYTAKPPTLIVGKWESSSEPLVPTGKGYRWHH